MNTVSNDVLSQKLDSLARCLSRIESKKPFTLEKLNQDFDLQDILAINIERAVQICADISAHCISPSPSSRHSLRRLQSVGCRARRADLVR